MADESLMEKWAKQNTNWILKLNTAIEHFMTSSNAAPRVARRFTYAIRGMYSVINKLNVATLTAGKALERFGKAGGLFGKLFGSNKELKEKTSLIQKLQKYGDYVGAGLTSGQQVKNMFQVSEKIAYRGRMRRQGIKRALGFGIREETGPTGEGGFADFMATVAPLRDTQLSFWKANGKRLGNLIRGLGTFVRISLKFLYNMLFAMAKVIAAILLFAFVWPSIQSAIEKVWPTLEKVGGVILAGINMVWEGLSGIFDFLFGDATLEDFMNSVFDIVGGLLTVAVGFIGGALILLGAFLFKVGQDLWKRFKKYMLGLWENSKGTFWLTVIGIGVAIVAWLYGFPVLMPALLVGAIYFGVKWLWDKMTSISFFAGGGVSKGGLAIVGEKGPELVNLPRGSRVHSNRDSRKIVSSGGSTINVTINAHSLQDTELRRIAQKVGDMINRQVNRGTSSSTVR